MGHQKHCPSCGRFGSSELKGYCKKCYKSIRNTDKERFLDALFKFQQESPHTVMGALAEVGAKTADAVSKNEWSTVLNICERRLPRTRKRHVVQDETFVGEEEFWGYRRQGEFDEPNYKGEKGGYDIER